MRTEAAMVGDLVTHDTRRLAAIAFADVVGWSALIERDDLAAMLAWRDLRSTVVEPLCVKHNGRIIEIAGDAVIVELTSAVAAARWAMELQGRADAHCANRPVKLRLRVGVTVDDVLVESGKVVGDGVNIAARLQQLGEPGDVLITSTVADLIHNKTDFLFEDMGHRALKNIDRSVRVLRLVSLKDATRIRRRPHLEWASRPRIAVLPFTERGVDPTGAYFGDGITDEIITRLSKSRSFYVIARASTSRYVGQKIDTKFVAEELGVRYLLTGNVQRSGNQLRINAELVDAQLDQLVWTERFLGSSEQIFEIQASIAAGIAAAIEPNVERLESVRAFSKTTHSLSAYDCLLRGQAQLYSLNRDEFSEAKRNLEQAIALDSQLGRAHAYVAWWHNFAIGEAISSDANHDKERAMHHATRAVDIDGSDAVSLAVLGHVSAFLYGRLDDANHLFDQALKINDSSAFAWGVSASTCCFSGKFDEALERIKSARQLSPFDPLIFFFTAVISIAEFGADRLERAIDAAQQSLRIHPRFLAPRRILCAALALHGADNRAREAGRQLMQIDPTFRVDAFCAWYPLPQATCARLRQGLLAAGLPV